MSAKLVSVAEASVILGVGVHTLKKKLKAGKLLGKLTVDGWMIDLGGTPPEAVQVSDIQKEETTVEEEHSGRPPISDSPTEELPQVVDQEETEKEEGEKEETYDNQAEEDERTSPARKRQEGAGWWF